MKTIIHTHPQAYTGINLINTENHRVYENILNKCVTGIQAYNTKNGYIGAEDTDWHGNIFNENRVGLLTKADNLRLQIKCNKFNPSDVFSSIPFITNMSNKDVTFGTPTFSVILVHAQLANQGISNVFCNSTCPAGNQFNENSRKNITSSSHNYKYWKHDNSNNLNLELTPVPNSNINVNTVNFVYWVDDTTSCKPFISTKIIPSGGYTMPALNFNNQPYSTIDSLEVLKQSAISEKEEILNGIDNGQTQTLLDAINSSMPDSLLAGMLISNSPLSDTVLISLITRTPEIVSAIYTLIMMDNVPVSNKVFPFYIERYQNLPQALQDYLDYAQENPEIITPATVDRKIQAYDVLKSDLTNRIVTLLIDTNNNRINDALLVLENDGSINSKKIILWLVIDYLKYHKQATKT